MEESIKKANKFNDKWKAAVILSSLISVLAASYYRYENTQLAKKVIQNDSIIIAQSDYIQRQMKMVQNLKKEVDIIKSDKFVMSYLERQSLVPTVYKTLDGKILSVNPPYVKWFLNPRGFTAKMYIEGGDELVWPEQIKNFRLLEQAARNTGQPVSKHVEFPLQGFKQGQFEGDVTIGHLYDENGEPLIVQVVIPVFYD